MSGTPAHLRRAVPELRTRPAPRGFLIAYTVWNKADTVPILMTSLMDALGPDDASLLFVFDSPEDDSLAMYWRYRVNALHGYHCLPPVVNEGPEWYESGSHRAAMDVFLARPEFHTLVVFQDDQRLRPEATLVSDLEGLRGTHGDKLGVVSGRDGWQPGFKNAVSAPGSGTRIDGVINLSPGTFATRPLHNRGPIVYPRKVVETIGGLDLAACPIWHAEVDYAWRAYEAGFANGVLGIDLVHRAIGKVSASRTYQGQEAADRERLLAKHGRRDLL